MLIGRLEARPLPHHAVDVLGATAAGRQGASPTSLTCGYGQRYGSRAAGSSCLSKPITLTLSSLARMTMLAARSGIQPESDR